MLTIQRSWGRRLIGNVFALALAGLALPALGQVAVQFDFYNAVLAPQGTRAMYVYPECIRAVNPLGLSTRDRIYRAVGTNGSVTVSNLVWGDFRCEFVGTWTNTINWFTVPNTNAGVLLYATNLINDAFICARSSVPAYSTWSLKAGSNTTFRKIGAVTYVDSLAGSGGTNSGPAPAGTVFDGRNDVVIGGTFGDTNSVSPKMVSSALSLVFGNGLMTVFNSQSANYVSFNCASPVYSASGFSGLGSSLVGLDGGNIMNGTVGLIALGSAVSNSWRADAATAAAAASVTTSNALKALIVANTAGVATYAGRTGAVVPIRADVTNVLGFAPSRFAGARSSFLRKPPLGFIGWPSGTNGSTEDQVLIACTNIFSRGYVAAGWDLFLIEDTWGTTVRDGQGKLQVNTNNWPHGFRWLNDTLRDRFGMVLGIYMQASGESYPLEHPLSNAGTIPVTDWNNIEVDAGTVAGDWGISYIRMDWWGFTDWESQRLFLERFRAVADYVSKTNLATAHQVTVQWFTDVPSYWDFGRPSPISLDMPGLVNVMRVGPDAGSTNASVRSIDFLKANSYVVGPGHYLNTDVILNNGILSGQTDAMIRRDAALPGMMSCAVIWGWGGLDSTTVTYVSPREELIKNPILHDIVCDPLALPAVSIYTNMISGTNGGEAWIKGMANGDTAVALWCRDHVGVPLTNQLFSPNWNFGDGFPSDSQNGPFYFDQRQGTVTVWTNAAGTFGVVNNTAGGTTFPFYWYMTNAVGTLAYYWTNANIGTYNWYVAGSPQVFWQKTNSFKSGNGIISYPYGRTMTFGTTNLPQFPAGAFTYRRAWTQKTGTAVNYLSQDVLADDVELFRVKSAQAW